MATSIKTVFIIMDRKEVKGDFESTIQDPTFKKQESVQVEGQILPLIKGQTIYIEHLTWGALAFKISDDPHLVIKSKGLGSNAAEMVELRVKVKRK